MPPPEYPPVHSSPRPQAAGLGRLASFLSILVLVLVVLNIFTLADRHAHQWAYGHLQYVLDLVNHRDWLKNSPTATRESDIALATEELRQGNILLRDKNSRLSATSLTLQMATEKLAAASETLVLKNERMITAHQNYRGRIEGAGRKLSGSIAPRALRGAKRNISSLAGEAVPYFGVAISVWSVYLDVIDACENVKALNEMNDALGIPHNSEGSVCGLKVPSATQLRDEVSQDARGVFDRARKELDRTFPGSIPALPSATEMSDKANTFLRSLF